MKKLLIAITSFALAAPLLVAAPAMAQNSQQDKMKQCNADAAGKKGDERKAFMSSCLKKDQPAKPATQQDKMKQCNADAAGKKGDERKAFMSSCLKKDK
ncbi:MAG: Phosphate starvation-inducible protein PsiF [Herbaspirillum frisingense]|uniref:Phosphate starvation-inducible protein PsiF n=1 Tax=Herbaspirillum frisingense TaxID=92645 RepID=A0A7V8G0P1_9BURK|nr:MAG: Phosphate starvation-inducible protein PsiF [Herbaspirillum frisingense]